MNVLRHSAQRRQAAMPKRRAMRSAAPSGTFAKRGILPGPTLDGTRTDAVPVCTIIIPPSMPSMSMMPVASFGVRNCTIPAVDDNPLALCFVFGYVVDDIRSTRLPCLDSTSVDTPSALSLPPSFLLPPRLLRPRRPSPPPSSSKR